MIPSDTRREVPGRKRTHEQESPDARKSLRTDVFCSWPGAERKGARKQTNELVYLSHDAGRDTLASGSRRHSPSPSQKRRQTHVSQRQAAPSDDEIQMTGWRHVPEITDRLPPSSKVSKSCTEVIIVSSDEENDDRLDQTPVQTRLKRRRSLLPSSSRRSVDVATCSAGVQAVQPPRKRIKKSKPPENDTKLNPILILDSSDEEPKREGSGPDPDSDSDYDNLHGGYVMNWAISSPDPNIVEPNDEVDFISAAVAKLSLNRVNAFLPSSSQWPKSQRGLSHSWAASFVYRGPPSFLPPARLRPIGPLQKSYGGGRSRTGLLTHRPSQLQSPLTRLKRRSGFHMADACQTISQNTNKLLVASATPGGTMEDEGSENEEFVIDPYNTRETLAIWSEEQNHKWLPAHYVNSNDPGGFGGPFRRKFYDVKCARFDPKNSNIFASTGLDGVLTVWNLAPPDDKETRVRRPARSGDDGFQEAPSSRYDPVKKWGKETYGGHSCFDIVYRPHDLGSDKTLFAAPCQDGTLFIHSYTDTFDQTSRFAVRPLRIADHVQHKIGATVWGYGSTSSDIFVCSEEGDTLTFHGAINIESGKPIYHFDDHRSGEELALDPEGGTLALFTAEEDILHLRLYDVRRGNKRHTAAVNLPSSSSQLPNDVYPEVRTVAWSPDSILLAVGKNDDVAHVYDVRCLERGPVLSMTHETHSSYYGITVLSWTTESLLRTPNLGLLTGGGDHCIALWDVRTACEGRQVIAELDGKVGVGSFGDFAKGEKPLVAGDIDGQIYIYDFVCKQSAMEVFE